MIEQLQLLDWKRTIFGLYEEIRSSSDPQEAWRQWRSVRDDLFRSHSQSPLQLSDRDSFAGLPYFEYDPAYRTIGRVVPSPPERYEISTSGDGAYAFSRIASVHFELQGGAQELEIYWLEGYGGGLFLPFRDRTAGRDSYGAGRYLFDTIKGADLGGSDGELVLDFNFSYNPSCAYDPKWVCPLAPPPNRMNIEVLAGERYSR